MAGPAVAEVSIEMDQGLVCSTPGAVNGTVTIGGAPVAQTVTLTSSHPDIAQVLPPAVTLWGPASIPCVLQVPAPVAERTVVTITAMNHTAGGVDQATVTIVVPPIWRPGSVGSPVDGPPR